jgi:hypothetical protein
MHGLGVRAHAADEPSELGARLPLAAQGDEERCGLHLGCLTAHHEIEGSLRLVRLQALADDESLDDGGEVVHRRGTSGLFVVRH